MPNIFINLNNVWKQCTPWINLNGVWKQCTPWINLNGVWKKCGEDGGAQPQ